MRKFPRLSFYLSTLVLVTTACAGVSAAIVATPTPVATPPPGAARDSTAPPLPGNLDQVIVIEDDRTYRISQLLPRDGIPPIYEPQFVAANSANLSDNDLVMGLAINGDARAYPVGILRSREMVDDVVGGTPVLVTW